MVSQINSFAEGQYNKLLEKKKSVEASLEKINAQAARKFGPKPDRLVPVTINGAIAFRRLTDQEIAKEQADFQTGLKWGAGIGVGVMLLTAYGIATLVRNIVSLF